MKRYPIPIMHMIYGLRIGGAERLLLELCKTLDPKLFRVEVVYFHEDEDLLGEFLKAGVPCTRFPVQPTEFPVFDLLGLTRFIRDRAPALVHVHLYHASRIGAMAARIAGVRTIVRTKHSLRDPNARPGKRGILWQLVLKRVVTCTVAVSQAIANQIGTPYVIHSAVDKDFFDTTKLDKNKVGQFAEKIGLTGSPVLTVLGRLVKVKGHDVLLKALPDLLRLWPDLRLLLAGDGDQRARLEFMVDELNVRPHVTLLGSVTEVRELLACTDLLVQPSRMEGLGISVLEAMAMRIPVVATDVGGLRELINNGVDGVLVEPDDPGNLFLAIQGLFDDPQRMLQIGNSARYKIEKSFDLVGMALKYQELYTDLLREQGPGELHGDAIGIRE